MISFRVSTLPFVTSSNALMVSLGSTMYRAAMGQAERVLAVELIQLVSELLISRFEVMGGNMSRHSMRSSGPVRHLRWRPTKRQRIIAMVCSGPPGEVRDGPFDWWLRKAVKRRLVPRIGRKTIRL